MVCIKDIFHFQIHVSLKYLRKRVMFDLSGFVRTVTWMLILLQQQKFCSCVGCLRWPRRWWAAVWRARSRAPCDEQGPGRGPGCCPGNELQFPGQMVLWCDVACCRLWGPAALLQSPACPIRQLFCNEHNMNNLDSFWIGRFYLQYPIFAGLALMKSKRISWTKGFSTVAAVKRQSIFVCIQMFFYMCSVSRCFVANFTFMTLISTNNLLINLWI